MVPMIRHANTNLYIVDGLPPSAARFAFVANPADPAPAPSVRLDQTWGHGFYAFFPAGRPEEFLTEEAGRALWTRFNNSPPSRLGWFNDLTDFAFRIRVTDNRQCGAAAFAFGTYEFSIRAGAELGFTTSGFRFTGTPRFSRTEVPFEPALPGASYDLRVIDNGAPTPAFRSVAAFTFALQLGGEENRTDYDALDVGFYFVAPRKDDPDRYLRRRFGAFQPLAAKTPAHLTGHIDPLALWDTQRSFLAFDPDHGGGATVTSLFRTTLGKLPTLAPVPAAEWWVEEQATWVLARPRVAFTHRPGRRDVTPDPLSSPSYLTPAGRFRILEAVPGPDDTQNADPLALRLLCGNSGTEYVLFAPGDVLRFHPTGPAFFDLESPGAPGDPRLTDDQGRARTAWVSLRNSPKNPAPRYRAQPDDAPLYAPEYKPIPGDPDATGTPPAAGGGLFDFQQVPMRSLDETVRFPMVPAAGYDPDGATAAAYLELETLVANPDRRRIILRAGIHKSGPNGHDSTAAGDLFPTVTPQGLLARLDPGANLGVHTIVVAKSEPAPEDNAPAALFQFESVGSDQAFLDALHQNKLLAVLTGKPTGTTFDDLIDIVGWKFRVPFGVLENGKRSLLIFKFYDRPLTELAKDPMPWAKGGFTNISQAQDALRRWIAGVEAGYQAGATQPVNLYAGIHRRITDPNWTGVLAVNVELNGQGLPEGLRGLTAGIDLEKFKADHVGVDVNRFAKEGPLELLRSSLFGLIDYTDPADPTIPLKEFGYRVKQLQALFENSALNQFKAKVELGVKSVFKQSTTNPTKPVTLTGSYERRTGTDGKPIDVYAFTYDAGDSGHKVEFGGTAFISELRVNSVRMTCSADPNDPNRMATRFAITGGLKMGSGSKYLCIEDLRFNDLTVEFLFRVGDSLADADVNVLFGLLRFDLAASRKCANSLLELMPLDFRSFFFAPREIQVRLPEIGFLPLSFPTGLGRPDFDFGLSFRLELGSLGALAASLKDFAAEFFVGWKAGLPDFDDLVLGFRLPEGRKEFTIQGVLKLIIGHFQMCLDEDASGDRFYAIILKDCRVEVLGAAFPPNAAQKFDLYLFPNPKAPLASRVGWWGAYQKDYEPEDPPSGALLLGLGQRIAVNPPEGEPATVRNLLGVLSGLPHNTNGGDEDLCQQIRDTLSYSAENEWTVGLDFSPIKSLRLAAVFNDPHLYALLVQVRGLFSFEITYRKIADDLGVYSFDIGLPDSIREITVGVATLTLPRFGGELFTNGDYRIDIGFPARLDFSRSFKFQILPFIGAGGFYVGKLNGLTAPMLTTASDPIEYKRALRVAVFGLGLRVGLGTEREQGIFRYGVSVSLYGILEGALGYEPNNNDFLRPDRFMLAGRVGILAQLYGTVDFGIVKASVTIVIEVGMPFTLACVPGVPFFSIPYVEGNVAVDVEIVIGRFKIFGKKSEITITVSFRATIRIELGIESSGDCAHAIAVAAHSAPTAIKHIDWQDKFLDNVWRAFAGAAGPVPLPLYFTPAESFAADRAQMLALLAVRHGMSGAATEPFDRLAAAIWVAAWKCSTGTETEDPRSEQVTLSQLEDLCRQLEAPDALARAPVANPLDYERIRTFLKKNFQVVVGKPPDGDQTQITFFPMLPALRLQATKESIDRTFSTFNEVDPDYQRTVDTLFDRLFLRFPIPDPEEPTLPESNPPRLRAVPVLVFEQFLDYLVTSTSRLYLRRLQLAKVDTVTLGDLIDGGPDPAAGVTERPMSFDQLAGVCGTNFYSALRLPVPGALSTSAAFYTLSGQQFPITVRTEEYPVSLTREAGADWLDIAQGALAPEYGQRQDPSDPTSPVVDGLDPAMLAVLEQAARDWLPELPARTSVSPLISVQRNGRRFSFPELLRWRPGGAEADRTVMPFPLALRRTLRALWDPPALRLGRFTALGSNDTFSIQGLSGLAVDDRIAFQADDVQGLPAGVVDGDLYWVKTVAGDNITISATRGGDPLDLTSDGAGVAFRHDLSLGAQLTQRLSRTRVLLYPQEREEAPLNAHVKWASLVRLTLRRVSLRSADGGSAAAQFQPFTYELAGAAQDQRLLLDGLRLAPDALLARTSIRLLYATDPDGATTVFESNPASAADAQVVLYKTTLSTESRPPEVIEIHAADVQDATPVAATPYEPAQRGAFIRLAWECATVNSGGYYLYYRRSDGSDPLKNLYAGAKGDKADLWLLVELDPADAPPNAPPPVTSINAATALSGNVPADQRVYATVERSREVSGQTVWDQLGFFEATLPPGCLGFTARRDRFENGIAPVLSMSPTAAELERAAKFDIDNLYSRLAYQVRIPADSGWTGVEPTGTLPVQPVPESRDKDKLPADKSIWRYTQVLRVAPQANPYTGVGKRAGFTFAFRDVYGNETGADGLAQDVRLLYHDALVPVGEWPGVTLWLDVREKNGVTRLVVLARFDPRAFGEPGGTAPVAVAERYKQIQRQYEDGLAASTPVVATRIDAPNFAPARSWSCYDELVGSHQSFLRQIVAQTAPGAIGSDPVRIVLKVLDIAESDLNPRTFFEMGVRLTAVRQAHDSYFPLVAEPWETVATPFPAAKGVESPIALPGGPADGSAAGTGRLAVFAEAFEEKVFPGADLRLAAGADEFGVSTLWVIRKQPLSPSHFGDAVHFAPAPLSTDLQSGTFLVTEPVPSDGSLGGTTINMSPNGLGGASTDTEMIVASMEGFPSAPEFIIQVGSEKLLVRNVAGLTWIVSRGFQGTSISAHPHGAIVRLCGTRTFADIDLDREMRDFLEAVEQFLAPSVSAPLVALPGGRPHLEAVIRVKRYICGERGEDGTQTGLPKLLLHALFKSPSGPSRPSDDIYEAFRQRMLSDLRAAYGIDSVLQFPTTGSAVLPPDESRGVNLFGPVQSVKPDAPNDIDLNEAKIRYRGRGKATPQGLVVLADARTTARGWLDKQLAYLWTHLEHRLEPGSDAQPYRPSRWLSLVRPVGLPIAKAQRIFLPLREYPTPPQLDGHTAVPVPLDGNATAFERARQWYYAFAYRTLGVEQDKTLLSVELNPAPGVPKFTTLAGTEGLLAALMDFRTGYPDTAKALNVIRTGTDAAAALRLAEDFARRATAVARGLDTEAFSQAVGHSATVRLAFEVREDRTPMDDPAPPAPQRYHTKVIVKRTDKVVGEYLAFVLPPPRPNQPEPQPVIQADGSVLTEFDEEGPTGQMAGSIAQPFWWQRVLRVGQAVQVGIQGVDVLRFETARGGARLVRNQITDTVAELFIYRTPLVWLPEPLTPRIDRPEPVVLAPPTGGTPQPLDRLLRWMLNDSLFAGFHDTTRRLRLEAQFGFDPLPAVVRKDTWVTSPAKLLPPQDVPLPVPDPLLKQIGDTITAWCQAYKPARTGALVFRLLVYSSLSGAQPAGEASGQPTLALRRLILPLSDVRW